MNSANRQSCKECRAPLGQAVEAPTSTRSCPNCNADIAANARFCTACGQGMEAAEPATSGASNVQFDERAQLQAVEGALLKGEVLEAVFDMLGGATGFVGITSRRVIVYDKAFLHKMKAVVSIPYSRIHSVAAEDESELLTDGGFFSSSKLVLSTSKAEYELEFRGADKAHIAHDLIVAHLL
jgi:hypothetical protein